MNRKPCEEIAECLGINAETVFWFDRGGARKPVISVWMAGWTNADSTRRMKMKVKVKTIAGHYGAKVYMTKLYPHEHEELEKGRQKNNRKRYRRRRGIISGKQCREKEWRRQEGLCMWCNKLVSAEQATLEHILPLGKGGNSELTNLGMSCGPCNWNRHKIPRIVTFWKLFKFRVRMKFRVDK